MITREMIKKGFENGIISIEDDYAGDSLIGVRYSPVTPRSCK